MVAEPKFSIWPGLFVGRDEESSIVAVLYVGSLSCGRFGCSMVGSRDDNVSSDHSLTGDSDLPLRCLGASGNLVKWTRTFLNLFLSVRSFMWSCCVSAGSPMSVTSLFLLVPLTPAVPP